MAVNVAAVDLGASSGRVVLGEVGHDRLRIESVARFANDPVRLPSGLHWNVLELYARALDGIATAVELTRGNLTSVGIDSWAVDYGLLRNGRLLGVPFHYRDEARNAGSTTVHTKVTHPELYARNGLQYLPFNTIYQLANDPWLADADRLLLVPDLIGYWLTGREVAERTNASTTGLLDVHTGTWDTDLMGTLGYHRNVFGPLVSPGEHIGTLLPSVGERVRAAELRVVAVGSHDTASAVVAVPMTTDDAAYISCGTWGLVGLELETPVLTSASLAANFTNEGGVDGRIRFLTNVMGLWLLSETIRQWERSGTPVVLADLLAAAAAIPDEVASALPVFDVQDVRFLPPGDMPTRIASWFAEREVAAPEGRAALVRCIVESLAQAFADSVDRAAELSGRTIGVIHMVGGGALNTLLCQLTADRSGRRVLAGPVEATALGNVLVQGRAAGAVTGDLEALRRLVAATQEILGYEPRSRREKIRT